MNSRRLMAAFPPEAHEQITLSNWRQHPFSEWAFRNVRELLPTANIARASKPAPLSFAQRYLDDVSFAGRNGEPTNVGEALRTSYTDGIVVMHRGQVMTERYAHGLAPDTPHLIFSVSKSIAGTLAGILTDRGKLDPDAPVTRYIPEMKDSVYGGSCTVRHLLDMSVGIRFDEDYMAREGDVIDYRRSTGWEPSDSSVPPTHLRQYLQTLRPDGTPHGQTFHYVSTNTDVLGWVYERACGMSGGLAPATLDHGEPRSPAAGRDRRNHRLRRKERYFPCRGFTDRRWRDFVACCAAPCDLFHHFKSYRALRRQPPTKGIDLDHSR